MVDIIDLADRRRARQTQRRVLTILEDSVIERVAAGITIRQTANGPAVDIDEITEAAATIKAWREAREQKETDR